MVQGECLVNVRLLIIVIVEVPYELKIKAPLESLSPDNESVEP